MRRFVSAALLLLTACASAPEPASIDTPAESVQQIVYLQHAEPAAVVESLMQLGTPYQVSITENAGSNSLLVRGDETSVHQVLELIAKVDQPQR